jgi:hypothetical protein
MPLSLALAFFYAGTLVVGLTTFRPVASFFNGSDTLYLIAVLLLVIRLLHEGQSLISVFVRRNPFFKPLLVFLFGATLSLINSDDLMVASIVMGKYIFLFGIWLPAGITLLDTPRRIKWMLVVLVAAALVPLIPAIGDYYFQTRITVVIDRLLSLNLEHTAPHGGRFGSVMGHPNNFGFMLVVVFPVSLWLLFFVRTLYIKIFGLLFICLLLTGGLITASRSMAVAVSVQALFFIAFMPQHSIKQKTSYLIFLLMLAGTVLAIAAKAQPLIILDRFLETTAYELGGYEPDSSRIDFMVKAWRAIVSHPIAGLGVENASANLGKLGVLNTILRLWAGIGVFGLVFISWIYILALHTAIINLKKTENQKTQKFGPIAFLVLVALIGWFLVDMVQPQFYDRFKFVSLIILFSLSRVIETNTSLSTEMTPLQPAYAK